MARQVIDVGAVANDGTGDPLREAFLKTNDNFSELYQADIASLAHEESTSNPHGTTAAQVGADITSETVHGAPGKDAPDDLDEFPALDSADGWQVTHFNWAVLKAALQNALATVFAALNHNHTGTYEAADPALQSHLGAHDNPHAVSVEQIGAAPAVHDHAAAYEPLNLNIQAHIAAEGNPHATTAHEVGAYTAEEVNQLIAAVTDPRLGQHLADTTNPHGTTAAQVGAYTSTQTDTLLSGKADAAHDHAGTYEPAAPVLTALAPMTPATNTVPLFTASNAAVAGQITSGYIAARGVSAANLYNGAACSVIGRSAASTGAQANIAAATNGFVLRRSANVLGFGLLRNENLDPNAGLDWTKVSKTGAVAADVGAASATHAHAGVYDPAGTAAGTLAAYLAALPSIPISVSAALSTTGATALNLATTQTAPNVTTAVSHKLTTVLNDGDITAARARYNTWNDLQMLEDGVAAANTGVAVTGITTSGQDITVACAGHAFIVGDLLQLSGVTPTTSAGCFKVASIVAGVSVTYKAPNIGAITYTSGGVLKKWHGYAVSAYGCFNRGYLMSAEAQPGGMTSGLVCGAYNQAAIGSYSHAEKTYGSYNEVVDGAYAARAGAAVGAYNKVYLGTSTGSGTYMDSATGAVNEMSLQNAVYVAAVYGNKNAIAKAGGSAYTRIDTAYAQYNSFDNASAVNGYWGAAYGSYTAFTGAGAAAIGLKVGWYSLGEDYNVFSGKVRIGDTATPTEALEVAGNAVVTGALTVASRAVVPGVAVPTGLVRAFDLGSAAFMDAEQVRRLSGDDTAWDDLVVPMTLGSTGPSAKPDFSTAECGLLFPQNDATEIVYINVQLPHRWKQGSRIYPHVHCHQSANQQAVMKMDYRWVNIGGTVGSWTTGYTLGAYINPYSAGTIHQILANITGIDGAGMTLSSILQVKLYRNDNAYTGDLLVTSFDIHHEIDGFGSETEYVKE